jgi:multidrug efflux pump subunit AcrB
MQIPVAADNTRFIESTARHAQLILGGAAAVLTILLSPERRTTLISAVPVPTAIVATFTGMHVSYAEQHDDAPR